MVAAPPFTRRALRLLAPALIALLTLTGCSQPNKNSSPLGLWKYELPGEDGSSPVTVILELKLDGTWHSEFPETGGFANGTWEEVEGHYELTAINSTTGEPLEWADGITVFAYVEEDGDNFVYRPYDESDGLPMVRASFSDLAIAGEGDGDQASEPGASVPPEEEAPPEDEDPLHPSAGYIEENYFGTWFSKTTSGTRQLRIGPEGCQFYFSERGWVDFPCDMNSELGMMAFSDAGDTSYISLIVLGEGTYGLLWTTFDCPPFTLECGEVYQQVLG